MSLFQELGKHLESVKSWNPQQSNTDEVFSYIDLSSVDKDKKAIDLSQIQQVATLNAPSRARQIVKEADILVSTVRPNLNGVAFVPKALNDATASTGYCVLRANEKTLSAQYLFYWVQTKSFINEMVSKATGANYPAVSDKIIKQSKIPLPPLVEQQKIAAILDAADSLRQKDQQLVERYTALSQSLFLEMFGDPMLNPKSWPEFRLSELSTFENGDRSSNYPSGEDIKDSGVLFLSTKNITESKLDLSSVQFISEGKFKSLSRGKAKKGDLLITLRGSLGNCCIFDCEYSSAFINAQMMIIRASNLISNIYLHSLITSFQFHSMLQDIGRGAAVQQLTASQLAQLYVMTPPYDMQTIFAERIKLIEIQKQQAQRSLEKSEGLFNSLLQTAFTGELISKGAVN